MLGGRFDTLNNTPCEQLHFRSARRLDFAFFELADYIRYTNECNVFHIPHNKVDKANLDPASQFDITCRLLVQICSLQISRSRTGLFPSLFYHQIESAKRNNVTGLLEIVYLPM